jgi:hypothetical protein
MTKKFMLLAGALSLAAIPAPAFAQGEGNKGGVIERCFYLPWGNVPWFWTTLPCNATGFRFS